MTGIKKVGLYLTGMQASMRRPWHVTEGEAALPGSDVKCIDEGRPIGHDQVSF